MKYKYFSILFLAVLIGLGHITFSEEEINPTEDSAAWWSQSIPEITIINDFSDTEEELEDLSISENHLAWMQEALIEAKKNKEMTQYEKEWLIDKIQSTQREIRRNIQKNQEETKELSRSINLLENEIKYLKERQSDTASFLRTSLAYSYQDEVHGSDDIGLYSIFFGQSLGNNFYRKDAHEIVQNSTQNLLSRQKSITENLSSLEKLTAKKIKINNRILSRLEKEKSELAQAEEVERSILSESMEKQISIKKDIDSIAQKRKMIEAKIMEKKTVNSVQFEKKFAEYETSLKERLSQYNCSNQKSPVCAWIEQYIRMEKQMLAQAKEKIAFSWPIIPNSGFGSTFRDQKYYVANNTHHEWLDILTPAGIPVQAVADGYILIKQYPNTNSPGIVIVKHANGYMSLYIGIIPNNKPMFSRVSLWDSIGMTRDYTEHSNQNNIHIELYKNWKATDILEKIDLSPLSPDKIPSRYGWKYIDDLQKNKKPVDINALQKTIGFFYIPGESEAERQKKLLSTYASNDFQNRNIWVEESLPESVDPTFVMCVGFAESTLGQNLTTDGNIGNVGNTDSGARQDFADSRSGIRAISSVVNNNWLGSYTTIDQLSGWWNPRGPIYASSRTNWHENIVKCMSALKQHYVWNNGTFRLSQASLLLYQQEWFSIKKDS